MKKYIIIHGHFYQPPRENPWTDVIPKQPSASPYHDWNERITNECYRPNGASRILDEKGRIVEIKNNYEYISFNFGPTLLNYIKKYHQDVYENIIEGDKKSRARNNGHGNAIAQVYNHIILPLSPWEDKITEIKWGIENFYFHFGRLPEGMWLSETAINPETIDALYEEGIKFTILSPYQAREIYDKEQKKWIDISGGKIDPSKPYILYGKKGHIFVFFYDGPISHAVSFEHLLRDGEKFFTRLTTPLKNSNMKMINIATDGESYGHHEPFGDMCLSYFLRKIEKTEEFEITNYARFLEENPPDTEVRLHEGTGKRGTSWSCIHGVERWRDDCGCQTGGPPEWNQKWRFYLRNALDILREGTLKEFENFFSIYSDTPYKIRNDFIEVIENQTDYKSFLKRYKIPEKENLKAIKLLLAQKYMLFSYTSCGWFFADISGIETVQNLIYAYISYIYTKEATNSKELEKYYQAFLNELKKAKSNIKEYGTGYDIFTRWVIPSRFSYKEAAATFIIYKELTGKEIKNIYNYKIESISPDTIKVKNFLEEIQTLKYKLHRKRFEILLEIDGESFSFKDLLTDDKEKLFLSLLHSEYKSIENKLLDFYTENQDLFSKVEDYQIDIPYEIKSIIERGIEAYIREKIKDTIDIINSKHIKNILTLKIKHNLNINIYPIEKMLYEKLLSLFKTLKKDISKTNIENILQTIDFIEKYKIEIPNKNHLENFFYKILKTNLYHWIENILVQKELYETVRQFFILGERLNFNLSEYREKLKIIEEKLSDDPTLW